MTWTSLPVRAVPQQPLRLQARAPLLAKEPLEKGIQSFGEIVVFLLCDDFASIALKESEMVSRGAEKVLLWANG